MNNSILWYATRGAGATSLILFTLVVALGIVATLGWRSPGWPRFLTTALHRNLALLSLAFLAIHIVTAVTDPFTALGWQAAVIPFSSYYRTFWLGLGVIALDLLLALIATSLLRQAIGHRAWRFVHWLAYACWPIAVVHGLGTGSDSFRPWMLAVEGVCAATVLVAVVVRLAVGQARREALIAAGMEAG